VKSRIAVAVLAVALLPLTLGGGMEMEQSSSAPIRGKYQGKPDTQPWANAPVDERYKWTKGDRTSWETQIKDRQLAQHEHKRIYQ
jgi:hypothetical protein